MQFKREKEREMKRQRDETEQDMAQVGNRKAVIEAFNKPSTVREETDRSK